MKTHIGLEDQYAICAILDLVAEDTASILWEPHQTTFVTYLCDDQGKHYLDDQGEVATETTIIPFGRLLSERAA